MTTTNAERCRRYQQKLKDSGKVNFQRAVYPATVEAIVEALKSLDEAEIARRLRHECACCGD